ncbi:MAG: AAA family ATPase [Methanomicrobium sp.]|nr:AAA family ATPase [Methanomicrobium sp.]
MAKMWPAVIPSDVRENILRNTEINVFKKFEKELDDSFIVFYSRPWLGLSRFGKEIDGECDFLVAHRDYGILSVEVKGGAVSYDPETEIWKTRDRNGINIKIKNPILQAKSSKYQILEKLNKSSLWRTRRVRAAHGVVLPHSDMPEEDLGMDAPLDIFCFTSEFETDFAGWIHDMMKADYEPGYGENPLGDDGIEALEDLLARPFQLHYPEGTMIRDDESAILYQTQQQFHLFEMIKEIKKIAVYGAAGTGKTVLAVEEALRCAGENKKVLLTCYNSPLAENLQKKLLNEKNITVSTFHRLCNESALQAGLEIPRNIPDDILFRHVYPGLLKEAFRTGKLSRFDVIIIDEGQDFYREWTDALMETLTVDGSGTARIFLDTNQKIYDSLNPVPEDFKKSPITLSRNLRNTQKIFRESEKYYEGPVVISEGPSGIDIKYYETKPAYPEIRKTLQKCVYDLIEIEKLLPEDITVLGSSSSEIKSILPSGKLGNFITVEAGQSAEGFICADSVRRFKGLESSVIILIISPEIYSSDELMYVGITRARTMLVLIGNNLHCSDQKA